MFFLIHAIGLKWDLGLIELALSHPKDNISWQCGILTVQYSSLDVSLKSLDLNLKQNLLTRGQHIIYLVTIDSRWSQIQSKYIFIQYRAKPLACVFHQSYLFMFC